MHVQIRETGLIDTRPVYLRDGETAAARWMNVDAMSTPAVLPASLPPSHWL